MRIALAQLNPIVGDIAGNTAQILRAMQQAQAQGADALVTGEMAVIGYPPRDLLFREGVVEECEAAVQEIARHADELTVFVGHPRRQPGGLRGMCNSVSVCRGGEVIAVYDKQLLPGYDVFDEDRYFDPGGDACVVEVNGKRVGVLICEDLWEGLDINAQTRYGVHPVDHVISAKCDVIVTLHASPFIASKGARHVQQLRETARRIGRPIVAVNQVGANDDLIFDGRSCVISASGDLLAALPGFEAAVATLDVFAATQMQTTSAAEDAERAASTHHDMRELYEALVLGVHDYLHKSCMRDALIGLSGGLDSAVTAVIAAAALGPEHVTGVMLPSEFSSAGSITDAEALAQNLGIGTLLHMPIRALHDQLRGVLRDALGDVTCTMTDENLQARLRGILLMAVSNSQGSLLLTTSNKSEIAVGYSTLYGDMAGAVCVLGDVLKTRVYELARWINNEHRSLGFKVPPIPESSITKPPSAELRPNQTDQDTLPPYETLDAIVERYVELEQAEDRIIEETGIDAELVNNTLRMIDRTEYKREQAAMILKVSPRAFGRGRVMPVVGRFVPLGARGSEAEAAASRFAAQQ